MMLKQIEQVSLTYLTQRYLWYGVAIFGLIAIPNIMVATRANHSNASPMLFILGMPMLTLLPFLVGQVKMQFAHSRARLMPRFLPAHLAVLGVILLMMMVFYPMMLARISRMEPLGLLALTFAIGAPSIWAAQTNRFWPMLVSMGVFYSLLTEWGMKWWIAESELHRSWHATIAIVGAILVCVWLRRICVVDEEWDDYQNNYQALLARRTGSEAIEQRRVVASAVGRNPMMSRIGDWWHARLGSYYGGSKLGLIRLLRYGSGVTPSEVNALFMLGFFAAYCLFLSKFVSSPDKVGGALGGVWFFVIFMIFLPGHMAGELLAQRRPRIANELFLPLSRQQLVDGLIAASAYNSIVVWLIMNFGLGILVSSIGAEITLQTAAMFLLLSASTGIAAMAVSLRIAVWPSRMKRFLVAWISMMALIPPLAAWWATRDDFGDAPFLAMSGVMLAIAAVLFQKARQAWLELELG